MKKATIIQLPKLDHPRVEDAGTIGVVEALPAKDVVHLAHKSNFSHIVQKDGLAFDLELATAKSMVENVEEFLADPIKIILGPVKAGDPERVAIKIVAASSDKKARTLDKFEKFVAKIKGARRIREQALLVADELYTNAMKLGQRHALLSPNLKARAGTVEFFAESDGSRLVIGCRDSFGELGFGQVLARITQCFEKGVVQSINQADGGAGVGSFMVFNTCVSYYCGVEKGITTIVCVALPLGVSEMDLASLPKNIHLVSA